MLQMYSLNSNGIGAKMDIVMGRFGHKESYLVLFDCLSYFDPQHLISP
jgi:hypothetical protein